MRKIKPKVNEYKVGSGLSPMKAEKSKPIYPTFRIELEHLPEAKDWKIGKEYTIEMKVKMIGISQSRYNNDAEFEIREIDSNDQAEPDDSDESEAEDETE